MSAPAPTPSSGSGSSYSGPAYYGQSGMPQPSAPEFEPGAIETEQTEGAQREGQAYPSLNMEGVEAKVYVPPIDNRDIAMLDARLKELKITKELNNKRFTAYIPGSPAWKHATQDIAAEKILAAKDETTPGESGGVDEKIERLFRARDAASEGSKWLYELELAKEYLSEKHWDQAGYILQNLTSVKEAESMKPVLFQLLGKIKANEGKLSESIKYFQMASQAVPKSEFSGVVKLLVLKLKNDIGKATPEEKQIVAQQMDLSDEAEVNTMLELLSKEPKDAQNKELLFKRLPTPIALKYAESLLKKSPEKATLAEKMIVAEHMDLSKENDVHAFLDIFMQNHPQDHDAWRILFIRVPSNMRHWNECEFAGRDNAKKGHQENAIKHFENAIAKAPADQVARLCGVYYESCKTLTALKKLAELGLAQDSASMCEYARQIRDSNGKEALEFANKAVQLLVNAGAQDTDAYKAAKDLFQLICWEQGAANKDAECMYQLALCYRDGTYGISENSDQFLKLMREADNRNHPEAAYKLAIHYDALASNNAPSSYYKFFSSYYEKAIQLQHKEAPFKYALAQLKADRRDAITRLELLANNDHAEAQFILAKYCEEGLNDSWGGLIISKNANKAIELYAKSAAQDYFPAQMRLGEIYFYNKDFKAAFEMFKAAANTGDPEALLKLGLHHWFGQGTDQNDALAEQNFIKAAEKGYGKAMLLLGDIYKKQNKLVTAREQYLKATQATTPDPEGYSRLASLG